MICATSCVFLEGHLLKFIPCIWQVLTKATVHSSSPGVGREVSLLYS